MEGAPEHQPFHIVAKAGAPLGSEEVRCHSPVALSGD